MNRCVCVWVSTYAHAYSAAYYYENVEFPGPASGQARPVGLLVSGFGVASTKSGVWAEQGTGVLILLLAVCCCLPRCGLWPLLPVYLDAQLFLLIRFFWPGRWPLPLRFFWMLQPSALFSAGLSSCLVLTRPLLHLVLPIFLVYYPFVFIHTLSPPILSLSVLPVLSHIFLNCCCHHFILLSCWWLWECAFYILL